MRSLLALLAVPVLCAQDPAGQVVGRWRSITTSKGGIGSIVQLRKDGVIDYSPGAVVEMKYRIEGNELVLPPATKTGPETRQTIEFEGESKMRMVTAGGPAVELTRQGSRPDAVRPILGEWTAPRETQR
jgi:hypothetical protein